VISHGCVSWSCPIQARTSGCLGSAVEEALHAPRREAGDLAAQGALGHGRFADGDKLAEKHDRPEQVVGFLFGRSDQGAQLVPVVGGLAARSRAGVTAINFALPASRALLERVVDAATAGRIVAPPITGITLDEAPALLNRASRRPPDGKTVITVCATRPRPTCFAAYHIPVNADIGEDVVDFVDEPDY
jgi:hypothetical protein